MKVLYRTFDRPLPKPRPHRAHEESWTDLPVIVEVKAGKQVAAAWGRWLIIEEHARAETDYRELTVTATVGDGTLLACRLSTLDEVLTDWPLTSHYEAPGSLSGPIASFAIRARTQAERSRTDGDQRPIVAVAMPEQSSDGLVVIDLSSVRSIRNRGDRK
jgi:hypothetical protein